MFIKNCFAYLLVLVCHLNNVATEQKIPLPKVNGYYYTEQHVISKKFIILKPGQKLGFSPFSSFNQWEKLPKEISMLNISFNITSEDFKKTLEFPFLEILKTNATSIKDRDISKLKKCHKIKEISLMRTGATSKSLSSLTSMPNLTSIELSGKITKNMSILNKVKNLKNLHLHRVIDSELKHIQDLNLCSLKVSGIIHGEFLENMNKINSLNFFIIASVQLTDYWLESIGRYKNLETIKIRGSNIESLKIFTKLKKLSNISLIDMPNINDKTLLQISTVIKKISNLELKNLNIKGKFLTLLKGNKNLKKLSLSGKIFNSKYFYFIKNLANLTELEMFNTRLDDSSFMKINNLPRLKILSLVRSQISNDSVKHILNFPNIIDLNISCNRINKNSLKYIKKITSLKKFRAEKTEIERIRLAEILQKK